MNTTKETLIFMMAVFVSLNLACNLSSAGGGAGPTASGGSSITGANQDQFTNGPDLPIIRKDKNSLNASQFIAKSLPVEVIFSGDIRANMVFKGALAEPKDNVSTTPSTRLSLFVVLQKDVPSVLYQGGEFIRTDKWVQNWLTELLDPAGNVVASVEYKRFASLFPNYPQPFKVYFDKIPENTSTARVTISMINEPLPLSCITPSSTTFCATAADLNFKIPSPMVLTTPVQLSLKIGTWDEKVIKKAVLGEFTYKFKNPLNKTLDYSSTLLFLDDSGTLVGYSENPTVVEANGIYNRNEYGDFYSSSFFSDIPTKALSFNTTDLRDLIQAVR
jgi:hypothetical protein